MELALGPPEKSPRWIFFCWRDMLQISGEEPTISEAPKISKLVNITPITMVYDTYNYSYWGL